METEKLYYKDVNMKKCDSVVKRLARVKGGVAIILDKTVFFPEGGGQPCDLGTVGGIPLEKVYENDGVVFHLISSSDAKELGLGDKVECVLDWDRRFENMQRHCGEHILSGAFDRLFGGVNRGFHMGEDYMTIDIRLEKDPKYSQITGEMASAAESDANRVIWSDLPVTLSHFDYRVDAEKMPLRKVLAFEDDISVVSVGDIADPADCVACCGTHPKTSGQVGLVKIYKVEKNKDMCRVYFDAGKRAFEHCCKEHDLLSEIMVSHSAGLDDLAEKLNADSCKNRLSRERLHELISSLIDISAKKILREIGSENADNVYEFPLLTTDELIKIGSIVSAQNDCTLMICDRKSCTLLLFSKDIDCGNFVKANAGSFGGKGGGKSEMARAVFPDMGSLEDFSFYVRDNK